MYKYQTRIKLHQTDAAGRMFFAQQLFVAHDAFESFLLQNGMPLRDLDTRYDFSLPIVHAESDLFALLCASDFVTVEMALEKIGTTSFVISYQLKNEEGVVVGSARTVHVVVDLKTGAKTPVPVSIREILKRLEE